MSARLRALGCFLVFFGILAPNSLALAASCDGVEVSDTATVGNEELVLNGLGIRKATILKVKVYVAALYLPQKTSDDAIALDASGSWHLELHFVRDVSVDDITSAWEEGFKDNSPEDMAALQDRIDQLNSMMTGMKDGGVLAFSSDGTGISVSIDGKDQGNVQGEDFAGAMLAIWLGPEPPNTDLKSGLLGGACA